MSSPPKRSPVLGYNHNLRYLDRTWHVQSEDSGVDNPAINTHVFHEGAILASVRSKYDVTLPEAAVQKLMQQQHKAMMRDLKTGVFDEKIERFYPGSVGKVSARTAAPVEETAAKTIAMPVIAEPTFAATPVPETVETPIVAERAPKTGRVVAKYAATVDEGEKAVARESIAPVSAVAEFDKAPQTRPSAIPAAVRAAPPPKASANQTQKMPAIAPKSDEKPASRAAPPAARSPQAPAKPHARPPQTPPPQPAAKPPARPPAQKPNLTPPSVRAAEAPRADTQKTPTAAPKNIGARTNIFPPPQPKNAAAAGPVTTKSPVAPVQRPAPKLVPSPPRVVVTSRRGATLPSLDDLQRAPARGARTAKTPGIVGEDPTKEKSLDEAILAYLADDAPEK